MALGNQACLPSSATAVMVYGGTNHDTGRGVNSELRGFAGIDGTSMSRDVEEMDELEGV